MAKRKRQPLPKALEFKFRYRWERWGALFHSVFRARYKKSFQEWKKAYKLKAYPTFRNTKKIKKRIRLRRKESKEPQF